MLDPELVDTARFEDIIALMVQEQFYWNKSEEYILYPKPDEQGDMEDQLALVWIHSTDSTRRKYLKDSRGLIQNVTLVSDDDNRLMLKTGEILPSGLGVIARSLSWETQTVQRKVLPSWYNEHRYDDPWDIPSNIWITEWVQAEPVPPTVDLCSEDIQRLNHVIRAIESLDGQIKEPQPFRDGNQRARYPDQNFHNSFLRSAGNVQYSEESRIDPDQILTFILNNPILLVLILVLPGLYGGIHLGSSRRLFPSDLESLLWTIASIDIIVSMPVFLLISLIGLGISQRYLKYESIAHDSWATVYKFPTHVIFIGYGFSRGFLVVESFISLRELPIGAYWTPSWLQMIPHI